MTRLRIAAATVFAVALALVGIATPAHAMHIGFYGTYGAGEVSGQIDDTWGRGGWDWDRDTEHVGFGFALEAPVAFGMSYRLGLGWERITGEGTGRDGELEGIVIDNDFTYDLVASPTSRFWIGPELRVAFFNGTLDDAPGGDQDYTAVGVGPVLGFDLALGPSAALSWKAGYLYTWYYNDDDDWNDDYYHHSDYYEDSEMDGGHAYASMAVLFRLWGGPPAQVDPGTYQPQGRW